LISTPIGGLSSGRREAPTGVESAQGPLELAVLYPLLGTEHQIAPNAMVMIGMIDLIGSIRMMIDGLMGRLGGERQFMIGWGADSVCTTGLVIVSGIFPGTKKNLRRWPMHEFPMSSYFAEMAIPIVWSQGKVITHRQGSHSFLHGVQRG